VGALQVRDWRKTDVTAWKPFGRAARGPVAIPAGTAVKLIVGQNDSKDLTPLRRLAPDALDALILVGNDLTDEGLASIEGLTGLRRLEINSTNATDAGVARLKGLTALRELDLYGLKLTDEGLAVLENFPKLERLAIAYCGITNAGLVHVKKLSGLRRLIIAGTRVSPEGLTVLKYDMPRCEIIH
jgi:Leucine-rich repeat (LRR) protein